MKSRSLLVLVLCCVVSVSLVYVVSGYAAENEDRPAAVTAKAWQHLALPHEDAGLGGDLGAQINRLGDQGWELVCVTPIVKDGTTVKTTYYFKRLK